MSNHRKRQRKSEIHALREAGRQAALDGRHWQTNPGQGMDWYHWAQGYEEGLAELEIHQKEETMRSHAQGDTQRSNDQTVYKEMELRDTFACFAMQALVSGICKGYTLDQVNSLTDYIGKIAYSCADSMLVERNNKKQS